ncbi:MAG: hypothetical protein WDZ37_00245 [Solirubrobacterales bacterium]
MGNLRASILACAVLFASLGVIGCGGSGENDSSSSESVSSAPPASDFPATRHRSLKLVVQDMRQGPQLAPSVSVLTPGRERFGFGLFDQGNRQIADVEVALYFARGLDETARGPIPARYEAIDVKPAYRSKTTTQDADSARGLYVAELPFRGAGTYLVVGVARLGGQLGATSPAQVKVAAETDVPSPGDRAIRVHTPTKSDVGGNLKKIDTRVPPDDMHDVDLADALDEHRPAVLLFATPALCKSRVCAPVTDVAEQVHRELGDEVVFIHQEVYRDNDPGKGLNPQLRGWHLRSEPFAFAIDSDGIVAERLEGAFSVAELEAAARRATKR